MGLGKGLLFLLLSVLPVCISGAMPRDTVAVRIVDALSSRITSDTVGVESLSAMLYVKENVKAERKNILLNLFPDMTRFDKGKKEYLAELLYRVRYIHNTLPDIKRVAAMSTFGHGNGEMDRLLSFMTPNIYGERLFNAEQLSPIYPSNLGYYRYTVDSAFAVPGMTKIEYSSRFDNIQLLSCGWVVVDDATGLPVVFRAEGWDEQCRFGVEYRMGTDSLERFLVRDVELHMDYSFLGNRLAMDVAGHFEYDALLTRSMMGRLERCYDMTHPAECGDTLRLSAADYMARFRSCGLSAADSAMYAGVSVREDSASAGWSDNRVARLLWRVGDEAISSHSLAWGSSDVKFSPVINPSYLSYSSNKGLAYRFALRFRSRLSPRHVLELKPSLGYNFKCKELYWGVKGGLSVAPSKRAAVVFDVGRESSKYSSVMLDGIKSQPFDSLDFGAMPFVYYRDFHVKGYFVFEPVNGFELQLGSNYYSRKVSGNALGMEVDGVVLKRRYRQFAPHMRVSWQPGVYHYYSEGRKVNLGSLAPRFSLDVEQGVSGLFGSNGVYTRAELDVQYKYRLSSSSSLYMRLGAGGYFHTRDIYFVDYSFLKNNYLPLDKEDELSGELQLLGSEWYSSANKYLRASFTYESPFLVLQKLVPSARFIKNEAIYGNILFISHLSPYTEYGYGVETPYINIGLFVSFENLEFGSFGYKLAFSLFKD